MQSKTYRPIESEDKDFHLVPCTLSTYKKLQYLKLQNSSSSTEMKQSIVAEFLISEDELNKMSLISVESFYKELVKVLFVEEVKGLEINISEVNKAMTDFFTSLSGS